MASTTTTTIAARVPHEVAAWVAAQGGLQQLLCRLAGVEHTPGTGGRAKPEQPAK